MAIMTSQISGQSLVEVISKTQHDALEVMFKEYLVKKFEPMIDKLAKKMVEDMFSQIDLKSVFKDTPETGLTYSLELSSLGNK